jgi:uncharacterized protein YydD (DUF2326 family)
MQLKELTIRRAGSVVRTVRFKVGLNLILDKPTASRTQSGNNVGKTTVLRLIDFCFGSDGADIWQDSEFKKAINQEVYEFLHGPMAVTVRLDLVSSAGTAHSLVRSFNPLKNDASALQADGVGYKKISDYRNAVRFILFGSGGGKPTLRQLVPKFVRSSPQAMSKTLRFLGEYGSDADYESLHLFLFGFFVVQVLEGRPRLQAQRKKLDRDLQALSRLRNEGEIEQLLLHLRLEIQELSSSSQLRGEVPEIAIRADRVTNLRSRAASVSADYGRYEAEAHTIRLAITELRNEYADIDRNAIAVLYAEAQRYIPELQRDWTALVDFIQSLRGRKERFLLTQAVGIEEKARSLRDELAELQLREQSEIGELLKSREFNQALEVRASLQENLRRLGGLEQNLADIRELKSRIQSVDDQISFAKEKIESEKGVVRGNVAIFNKFFSKLSKELYGEEYLLHFDESLRGTIVFRLSSVGSNVGSGKKMSQTAAFDLAYIDFLHATGIRFPVFVCHDGLESIHDNQLALLLQLAAQLKGQLIVATLRDKLPEMPEGFVANNTILELSQDDKLFAM